MRKGAHTHQAIVGHAVKLAGLMGLEGLTIGALADDLKLSKSGLFAHFRSKENLQIEVLRAAAAQFTDDVVRPAISAPRGLPRVQAMFERWLVWASHKGGGCPFVTAAVELDDRPGRVRQVLVETQEAWMATLARCAQIAVDEGHLRADLDTRQFAFEVYSLMLGAHYFGRLLEDPTTGKRTRAAFEALLVRARGKR
jgi:AcrR family transcriptional regulator